jgi:hypothetical protein
MRWNLVWFGFVKDHERSCLTRNHNYQSTFDEETRFAVTVLQNQTVQQAHEELSKSMAPCLPLTPSNAV